MTERLPALDYLIKSEGGLTSRARYNAFEDFVLDLVRLQFPRAPILRRATWPPTSHASGVEDSPRRLHIFDAVFPQGLDEVVSGPSVLEVKFYPRRVPPVVLIERISRVLTLAAAHGIISIVVAVPFSVDAHYADEVEQLLQGEIELVLWGYDEIASMAGRHEGSQAALGSPAQVSPSLIDDIAEESPVDWRDQQGARIDDLRAAYLSSGLSLFLGAGVSQGSGLPSWDGL